MYVIVTASQVSAMSKSSLFKTLKPNVQLHPSFSQLQSAALSSATRSMIDEAFARFTDKDGNFVEQFQTAGFDSRTFELYVSELLHSETFTMQTSAPQPDFYAEKNGVEVFIECTTANPTDTGDAKIRPYKPVNERDADLEDIMFRFEEDLPIRVGGALYSKLAKRYGERPPLAYWDLPHVSRRPFILAVQCFHEHGALSFSIAAVASYLYGFRQKPSWDDQGRLKIETAPVAEHQRDEKVIRSGFFELPQAENISGVLWTNAGTIPKFTRMGLSGPYPDDRVTALRFGNMYDFDPNAHAPQPFAYIVGDPGTPSETWGQEAVLFHNPKAKFPVPMGLFETVGEGHIEDGRYIEEMKSDFVPFFSLTYLIGGRRHRRVAIDIREMVWKHLIEANRIQSKTTDHPVWGDRG